jgi:serine/threonine protein kinase
VIELSTYVFEVLRKDEDFILYRGRSHGDGGPILVLSPVAEHPTSECLKRLEHECSLREALDPAWSARPIAVARDSDRIVLKFEDPGGVPLDQLLGNPLELALFLRLAVSLSAAIDHLHERGIIHKDIKPANVLADPVTGRGLVSLRGFRASVSRPSPPSFWQGRLPTWRPSRLAV